MSKPMYLREDVYFEPLFNHWYVWPYLIPPVTSARHMVNTHKRVMTSFVNNHKLHMMAVKEAALAGGEFLNCKEEQLDDIRRLITDIDESCGDMVALSDAVRELDELLASHTSGESIEPLYAKVPEPLRGCVEIFLDMEHRASYRLIEPLLYASEYYKPQLQSVSFGSLARVEERPFVLSTPRLPDENHIHLPVDFNSPLLDLMFRARQEPVEEQELLALLGERQTAGGLAFRELFTDTPPSRQHQPVEEGVRLQYIGHAGFVVETPECAVLIDPVVASRDPQDGDAVISYSELPPKIDYVLLTHSHSDHANIETLLQLRHKTRKVLVPKNNGGSLADPSLRLILRQLQFDVTEVDDLEEVAIPGGRIVSIPFLGEHGDLNIRSKTAWAVEVLGKTCFFGADSSNPDSRLYERLGSMFPSLDVLAIGMECVGAPYTWIYGALHTKVVPKKIKNSRRLNGSDCEQALPMVKAFDANEVFVYALGLEPWYKYFMGIEYDANSTQVVESQKFVDACKSMDIHAEALYGKKEITLS